MIAACPKCGARYRIDPERLRADGVRLRCSKCEAVFRVTPPPAQAERAAAERPPAAVPRSEQERRHLVLVADADVEAGKALANTLVGWGFESVLVHDGVEAILTIQRILPRVVILDAGLPRMFGFQICELMKRNESLRSIPVVLVGAIYHQDRYRRAPSQFYGADAYVERPQLPEALRPILRGFRLGVAAAAADPSLVSTPPGSVQTPQPPVSVPPQPASADAATAAAVADAERLARIIVSDVVLYNPEKFEAGIRDGNVLETLEAEMQEGRGLFEQRVELRVRESRDFLAEEIVRVARLRGMK